ncbi:MAG TPA: PAS domain-containing protein [Actinomycetota bacterium]|nr:PAS domain-containing protein [Actinomycetota bacterium]
MSTVPVDPQIPYREIVEHLPVVVYVATDDEPVARTTYMSPNVQDMLGYGADVFLAIGEDWTSLMHPDDVAPMNELYARTRAEGKPFDTEYRFVGPDGRVVWVHDRAMVVASGDGSQRMWQGVMEDITPRVEAEQAVEVSAARYATLLENLPAVVYEMVPDDDRRSRYVNRKIEDLLGYTMDEWLDQEDMWMEVLHPDDREVELAAHDEHSATGDPWRREYRLIGAEGQVVWVRDHATLMRDPDGNPLHWQGVMVDITAEKEAQRAIERANDELEFRVRARTAQLQQANEAMGLEIAERQRAEDERDRASGSLVRLLENVPAVVYLWQAREREDGEWFTYVGDQIASMLGYTPEEWADTGWRERVHPHDRVRVEEAAIHSIETGQPFQLEYRYLARDGRVVWVVDRATLVLRNDIGEPLLFEGVMIDVTAQREAESAAQSATGQFAELLDLGTAALYCYELDEEQTPRVVYVSPKMGSYLGMTDPAQLAEPRRWFDAVHPDDQAHVRRAVEHAWTAGADRIGEYRVIDTDGTIVWLADRMRCVERDAEGRPRRFIGTILDITEARNERDGLARRLDTISAIESHAPAAMWTEVTDLATGVARNTYMSPGCYELVGYTPEELIAERDHFGRLVHPDDQDFVAALDAEANETGTWDATYRVIHRDGSARWLHSLGRKAADPPAGTIVWHGIAIDVTARVEASRAADAARNAGLAPPV